MPRSSRSSRPTARSAPAPTSAPSGTRSASTAAAPHPQAHAAPPQQAYGGAQTQQRQPGMLANMASTMGGVAAGSVVGHGISNMLFGGGSRAEAAPPPAELPAPVDSRMNAQQGQWGGQAPSCGIEAKDFTKCLDATNDVQSCSYYLEALKACQSAAARY